MSKNVLIVVDVQHDFVDGALGTAEAQAMLPRLVAKVRAFDGDVIYTKDTHPANYLETQEGRNLPVPHCIEGTQGWELVPELAALAKERASRVIEKPTFGSVTLAHVLHERYAAGELASVELVGLCTDICVISNALVLKAAMPELPITVDPVCCAGVTPEKHAAALEVMRSCQIGLTA